jgi:hypothetical protein
LKKFYLLPVGFNIIFIVATFLVYSYFTIVEVSLSQDIFHTPPANHIVNAKDISNFPWIADLPCVLKNSTNHCPTTWKPVCPSSDFCTYIARPIQASQIDSVANNLNLVYGSDYNAGAEYFGSLEYDGKLYYISIQYPYGNSDYIVYGFVGFIIGNIVIVLVWLSLRRKKTNLSETTKKNNHR